MHVPRPVAQAQDLSGLRQVRQQRIVAGVLAMMRIEATLRPRHRIARLDHCAVDVDGQAAQPQSLDLLADQITVEGTQRLDTRTRELLEPVDHRARVGNTCQPTQPPDQRIAGDVFQMFEAPPADDQQRQHQQRQSRTAIIAAERVRVQCFAHAPRQLQLVHIAAHKLQPGIRCQSIRGEFNRQTLFDHTPQPRYLQPHSNGLLCGESSIGVDSLIAMQGAVFLHRSVIKSRNLFSDKG